MPAHRSVCSGSDSVELDASSQLCDGMITSRSTTSIVARFTAPPSVSPRYRSQRSLKAVQVSNSVKLTKLRTAKECARLDQAVARMKAPFRACPEAFRTADTVQCQRARVLAVSSKARPK
eukprot:7083810-Prymnesium_polylepis.1